jgi:hypothetical protein
VTKCDIVAAPTWVVHRDARWFEEPAVVRPERWADGLAQRLTRFAYFLKNENYQASRNPTLTMMAGNRVDLLVMAPTMPGTYSVCVQNTVDPSDLATQQKTTLFSVRVAGTPASGAAAQFIGTAPPVPGLPGRHHRRRGHRHQEARVQVHAARRGARRAAHHRRK